MDKKSEGFFHDDGTSVNPNLVAKPSLCVTCKYDGEPKQEILCMLNRIDQHGEDNFKCEAYEENPLFP